MKELIDKTIESLIINLLKAGPSSPVLIIKKIKKLRPNTPKQSVYLALRKLKAKEIIALSGKTASLHQAWVLKMKSFFTEIYSQSAGAKNASLLNLEEKEYITYNFNSLEATDMFWGHAFILFAGNMSAGRPSFIYNPHEWFLIARKTSELNLIKEAKRYGAFWLIGGRKPLDLEVKKYLDCQNSQTYNLDGHIFEKNYYFNCFGDYHIEVWFDKRAVSELEKIYDKHNKIDDQVISLMQKIIEKKNYKHKMKISKNAAKAKKIKNLFKKYFFIPKFII